MAFILGLGATAYVLKMMDASSRQAEQNKKTYQALNEAKHALIAWAVSHKDTPGLMPYPDRNSDLNGYDGLSDCPGGVTNFSHLIGRLPWKAGDYNDCNVLRSGLGKEFVDGSNEPLWYAVSKNLVHIYSPSGDPVINPGIINNPPYGDWLHIYDQTGQLVSDKVAVIIFAPGPSLNDQDRSGGAADATNYLDTFNLQAGGGAKSNRTYTTADEDFYMGEDSRNVRSDSPVYQHPYYFNDKLIYITIDELMVAVEKRVAGNASKELASYYGDNGFYPYAASLGAINNQYGCKSGNLSGLLPINSVATSCNCTSASSCNCSFSITDKISFKRSGTSTWSSSNYAGACQRSSANSQICECTGAGYCRNSSGTRNFTCDASGLCTTNTTGTYLLSGTFGSSSGGCSLACNQVSCTSAGSFSFTPCPNPAVVSLPDWFTANKWQDYIYYSVSSNCTNPVSNCETASPQLTVGTRNDARAILIATGNPVISSPFVASKGSAQSHPSCTASDYLDSNSTYEATNKQRSANYNDQTFIVAP